MKWWKHKGISLEIQWGNANHVEFAWAHHHRSPDQWSLQLFFIGEVIHSSWQKPP
jgi:hypothetical protein